jgi:type IV pilus assembly protein PilN
MPTINLLPWREELRQKRKKEFFVAVLMAVVMGGAATFGTNLFYKAKISHQEERNGMLTKEIEALNKQIAEIRDLEQKRQRLLDRTEVIQQLERSRPESVTLMDSLVDVVPPGVHLTEVRQQGKGVEIKGVTQSNGRVSAMMRNIDDNKWLKGAKVVTITYPQNDPRAAGNFELSATEIGMSDADEGSSQ